MIIKFADKEPDIHAQAYVAPTASIVGDVTIGANSSVWFGAVLRGDFNQVVVGEQTNIQDLSILHTPDDAPVVIGNEVTVGHRAIVHGCTIGDRVLIGMGAVLMDGVEVGEDSIVGAGAVVTEGTKIPPRSLVLGVPAKVKRELKQEEVQWLKKSAQHYIEVARKYR